MDKGWIKLHRSIIHDDLLMSDNVVFLLFIRLLLLCDRRTGSYRCGRTQLALISGENPFTSYKALKRLEAHGMVRLTPCPKYTIINITNWTKYQSTEQNNTFGEQLENSQENSSEQGETNTSGTAEKNPGNSKVTLNKKEETRTNNNVELATQIQTVYDLFCDSFNRNPNQYKLTSQRKIKIKARIKDAGIEMVTSAIRKTSKSSFHNGDNDRGWKADLDFILRNYEQVERLSQLEGKASPLQQIRRDAPKPIAKISDAERERGRAKIEEIRKQMLEKKAVK